MNKNLKIDCKTQFQYFNADPTCLGTELPGAWLKDKTDRIFPVFAGTLERRTRGRGGSDFQCPQRSGRSILSCSSKDLYMKKTYAWVFCADIVVPSCACRFCPPAYVSLPYLVCLVRYLRLFNHYLCSIHLQCFQVVLIRLV